MDDIPELRDVLEALQDKSAKWEVIGIHLQLSADELDIIKADSDGVRECLTGALRKWLSRADPRPTWKAVIEALKTRAVGEAALAKQLEERFTPEAPSGPCSPSVASIIPGEESETSLEVARRNLFKIKKSFAKLLKDVASKLKNKQLNLEVFHLFIVALFPPGKCIPSSKNIVKIFEAVTQNGLWSYWHYTPVENIIMEYAPNDDEMKGWLDNYRKDLSGYRAMTKIAVAMELYSSNIEEFEDEDPTRRLAVTSDPAYLRRLSVKLKALVTEKTLVYIDDLWLSLAEYFLLPSLSVLLDNIKKGCVEVSWLIPPHFVFQIVGNLQENAFFLESKGIVKVLLDGECVYNGSQDKEFRQRLVEAVSNGDIDEMLALLTSGIDINIVLEGGNTLLMIATYKQNFEVLSALLSYGADINLQNSDGWTALMLACELGYLKIVELFLEHNASIEIKTSAGWTAVMIACENGHLNVVRLLVERHANICLKNKGGHTCLMSACHNGHLDVVEFLLSLPQVDVNAKDEKGFNALMYTSRCRNVAIFQALLDHPGVDINAKSNGGCTALMFVCYHGHEKCAELLLSRQADVNLRDNIGWTVMMFSCCSGNVQIVKLLLSYEVDPNTQDEDGWTPLMVASSKDFPEIVQELLKCGANPDIKNKEGQTALKIARDSGYDDVVELLKDCTKVVSDAAVPRTDPRKREHRVPVGLSHLDYRAGLENRRIFRQLLEHGPESLDPPKPHIHSSPWQQQHEHGEKLPESK